MLHNVDDMNVLFGSGVADRGNACYNGTRPRGWRYACMQEDTDCPPIQFSRGCPQCIVQEDRNNVTDEKFLFFLCVFSDENSICSRYLG